MDAELLKAIGSGSAQLILAAGYIPVIWLVKVLWTDRNNATDKIVEMLRLQFGDAAARKDLWDKLTQTVAEQARAINDQNKTLAEAAKTVADLREDLRRLKT